MTVQLTAHTFATTIARGIVLVSWYAGSCEPSRALARIYETAAQRHPEAVFAAIDVDRERELALQCGIASLPTLMAFRDGALVFARAGFDVADSIDLVVRSLVELETGRFSVAPGESPGRSRIARSSQQGFRGAASR